MKRLLDRMSYTTIIPVALILAVAPLFPEPHLVEKVRMLLQGALRRPIDVFDLLLHSVPLILLATKATLDFAQKRREGSQSGQTG